MKLDFNLQIAQKQGLTLTAQVQQAIKLLHMTNMEIQEFVADQFQDNPFIETNSHSEENSNTSSDTSNKKELDKSLSENPYSCLLYTSPSPRDVEESRMPSSA